MKIKSAWLFVSLLFPLLTYADLKPEELVKAYYEGYNSKDFKKQTALMTSDFEYYPNQGKKLVGPSKYQESAEDVFKTVDEKCVDIVIYSSPNSKKLIAESYAVGKYIKDIEGYPKAKNQPYRVHVVEVFEFSGSKIKSLRTNYNEKDWLAQVSK